MRDKSTGRMHVLVLRCYQWLKRWQESLGASQGFVSEPVSYWALQTGISTAWIAFVPQRKSAQLIRMLAAVKAGARSVISRPGRSRIR